ncbi:MAG TPA: hypothetical protein PLY34_14440 [Ferruginibacter sp.]|nr:hypothetical protein [Ferruginibacter sp.]HPH92216.1 hypothetical protein [Ferruginibacter sp.]
MNAQSVGIGTASPATSAQLDITSTNKGLLMPRLTTAQRTAIANPANGLMVYDTNLSAFWFYNGSSWSSVAGSAASQWMVNGNNIYNSNSGNVGIGTAAPLARLTVDSSIMVDEANSNEGLLDRGALYFGSDKKVGITRSFLSGNAGRNSLGFYTGNLRRVTIDSTGQVGIGTNNPLQALHVAGSAYLSGSLGIGSTTPNYAFENLGGRNYMYYSLAIGPNAVPSSTYMLDVEGGPARFRQDMRVDGILNPNNQLNIGNNTAIEGTLTVNGGQGIMRNAQATGQLKYYTREVEFGAILGGHGLSGEGSFGFATAGFTTTPAVMVGDIVSTGGTVGELFRVQLIIYGCNTTSCKARLLNTSPNPVNYNITWNIVAIGN